MVCLFFLLIRPFINILLDLSNAPGLLVTEHNGIFALGSRRQCIWMGKATDNMDANFKLLLLSPRQLKRTNLKETGRIAQMCFWFIPKI